MRKIWEFRQRLEQTSTSLPPHPVTSELVISRRVSNIETEKASTDPKGKRKVSDNVPMSGSQTGPIPRKTSREELRKTFGCSGYKDVGELAVYKDFYSFRVEGDLKMRFQKEWRQEGGYLYHDEGQMRGYLRVENSRGHSAGTSRRVDYKDVGELSVYKDLYSFKVDGDLKMKYQNEWRQEGNYLYHDYGKMYGYLRKA